jgi:folate-binding protein YgfZ
MSGTPLRDHLIRTGAEAGEYCGAGTALGFGESRREFTALVKAGGVYDLGWRVHFLVRGRDRTRWLNGMVSNNIRDLAPGRGNYNFLLSAQGHILGDLYVYNRGEDFVATTERPQLETILRSLQKYIIMDQVELADLSGQLTGIGVQGPQAAKLLREADFQDPLPEAMSLAEGKWRGHTFSLARGDGGPWERYEIWVAPAEGPGIWDALVAAGAVPAGAEALEMFRMAAGIPRYGVDIRDRELPQETAQMQALHFGKGCYVGQEIVERIRARGNVHRTFMGFVIDGEAPAPGTRIQAGGKDTGEITSALKVPRHEDSRWATLALGYIRREHAVPGATLQAGDTAVKVSDLPFRDIL